MRRIKGYCPQGRCSPARILNKLAAFERRAAEKQQSCGWRRLISLSCHSACWVSIHHWGVYHMSDSVSTLVVRQAGEHDGWVLSSDTIRPVRAKRPEPVHNDQITPPPAPSNPPRSLPPHSVPCLVWLCIRRMDYACIVYLRKSMSLTPQINRYNGITDIDLNIPFKLHYWI